MGHVFVTQGDIRRLVCDAWLMPTGRRVFVMPYWFRDDVREALGPRLIDVQFGHLHPKHEIPAEYSAGTLRSYPFPAYPGTDHGAPQPWITNVGGNQNQPVAWYLEAVDQFVRQAAAAGVRTSGRAKPLLAMPLVGTGAGGQFFQKAQMTRALLPELYRLAAELDVDIALVTYDDEAFAAAQAERRLLEPDWTELSKDQRLRAAELARIALTGNLVLFLGAGASMGAGLPSWQSLLEGLADDAQLSAEERAVMRTLPPTDQARIIERELGRAALLEGIRSRIDRPDFSITHTLCARLPVETAVTLNYDRLFEFASASQGRPVHVIPNEGKRAAGRTLLKLHGCVSRDADIVLTRGDYMRYGERRAALAGFVQALLLTHHMLFVGFGLADDNFHRILDDVRKVLGDQDDAGPQTVGTALTLRPQPLLDRLWDEDFEILPMFDTPGATTRDAARRLEIFLDHLVFLTGQRPTYLLDKTYDGLLTEREREFRDGLTALADAHLDELRGTPLGDELKAFLRRLGAAE